MPKKSYLERMAARSKHGPSIKIISEEEKRAKDIEKIGDRYKYEAITEAKVKKFRAKNHKNSSNNSQIIRPV